MSKEINETNTKAAKLMQNPVKCRDCQKVFDNTFTDKCPVCEKATITDIWFDCAHKNTQKAGFHITRKGRVQRYKCKDCGSILLYKPVVQS